jgi:hypothetical protein
MSELTTAQDREYVQSKWKHVRSWIRDLDSYGTDQFNVALFFNEKDARWCDNPFKRWQMDVGKEDKVWHDAFLFTQERAEQIRQLEEQIKSQEDRMKLTDEQYAKETP